MIGFLIVFIGYQCYRMAYAPSIALALLTVFARSSSGSPGESGNSRTTRSGPTARPPVPRNTTTPASWVVDALVTAGSDTREGRAVIAASAVGSAVVDLVAVGSDRIPGALLR